MEIAGYIASIFIGLSLGLIGGGGSILTVPVMVYLFCVDAVLATSYSLFVVGATSIVGSITYYKKSAELKNCICFWYPFRSVCFLYQDVYITCNTTGTNAYWLFHFYKKDFFNGAICRTNDFCII